MNIFFDLYGTLIDIHTEEKLPHIWNKIEALFKENGYIVTDLCNKYFRHVTDVENSVNEFDVIDIFSKITQAPISLCHKASIILREESIEYLRLYDGVIDLLDELKKEGHNIYLLSNAQKVFTDVELAKCNIIDKFDNIFISSEYKIRKPNYDFFFLALKETNSAISESIMIGNDYINDILPARKIGMKTIFIETLLTPKHDGISDLKGFDKDKILNIIRGYDVKKI